MKLELITLATVKSQLGITDSTYDAKISAAIPIVSSDVRRILNTNFDTYIPATITAGSNVATVSICGGYSYANLRPVIEMGQVVSSPALPDDTYITGFDSDTARYTLSASATADEDHFYTTVLISQWPTISKMIWYRINTQNTADATKKELSSVRYGPVSKSFADSEINKQYNYPSSLIKDLGPKFLKV